MTRAQLKTYIARKCALLNSANTYVDGLVSETDLNDLLNIQYKTLFMELAEKYPFEYEVTAKMDTVADQQTYTLGGDMTDSFVITYVGIKYASTDTKYTRVRRLDFNTAHEGDIDTSIFSVSSPRYYHGTVKYTSDDKLYKSISLLPIPDASVENGLYFRYTEIPQDMDEDTDEPYNLPATAHKLLAESVIADVWEIKGDWTRSDKALNRYLYNKKGFFDSYQPLAGDDPTVTINPRMINPYADRP